MTHNWQIIRDILIRLEEAETPSIFINARSFDAYPEQDVANNMLLLSEAGCIEAEIVFKKDGIGEIGLALANRLKAPGADLLNSLLSTVVWPKIEELFASKGMDTTFELVLNNHKRIKERLLFGQ